MGNKELKPSKKDVGHALIKGGMSMVPLFGPPAAEIFSLIVTPPLEKRRDRFITEIITELSLLEKKVDNFDIYQLKDNELFITTVTHATTIAMRNHQESKINALKNVIMNSALKNSPEDDLEMIFLQFIDSFTELHLRILNLLNSDELKTKKDEILNQVYHSAGIKVLVTRLNDTIEFIFPDLKDKKDIIDLIINDLEKNNLILIQKHHFVDTDKGENSFNFYSDGTTSQVVTDIGKEFLMFISKPTIEK